MEKLNRFTRDELALELDDGEIRRVARRQLIGSMVVAVMIAAVAVIMALRPAHLDTAESAAKRIAGIQQPTFVIAPENHVASSFQPRFELP
jgi:hypothetical protein